MGHSAPNPSGTKNPFSQAVFSVLQHWNGNDRTGSFAAPAKPNSGVELPTPPTDPTQALVNKRPMSSLLYNQGTG